jgi:oligoribonuclease
MEKLLWIDLEMTGLEVEKEVIIEAAAIITDMDFKALDTYETIIKQPQHYIDNMDEWNTEHHGSSGLTAKIPHGKEPKVVEDELIEFIAKHFDAKNPPCLAGNSISQDRLFIKKYFKNLESKLHYRMLDVSSWKIIFKEKYNLDFKKSGAHRALDDIQESIEELKFYMKKIKA